MELDPEINSPLLDNIENDLGNIPYIIENLNGVSYRKKNKMYVKIVQGNKQIISDEFTFKKKNKQFVNGDYLQILLLENIKLLRKENEKFRENIHEMKDKIYKLENK